MKINKLSFSKNGCRGTDLTCFLLPLLLTNRLNVASSSLTCTSKYTTWVDIQKRAIIAIH